MWFEIDQSVAGLRGLHKTLDDATDVQAAFISVSRSGEAPPDSLMEAAAKAVDELAEWRARIKEAVETTELRCDQMH